MVFMVSWNCTGRPATFSRDVTQTRVGLNGDSLRTGVLSSNLPLSPHVFFRTAPGQTRC